MNSVKKIFNSKEHAENYDKKVPGKWSGPEAVFGLSYKYVKSGESILDLGIGTGLTSILYHKAGLLVHGMDFSSEMLKVCRKKNIAVDLKEHDLLELPYPYRDSSMNHAVCAGVMHIFKDINPLFKEVSRILCEYGTFTFAVTSHSSHENSELQVKSDHNGVGGNFLIYRYNDLAINKILETYNFELINSLEFLSTVSSRKGIFKAYMTRKKKTA